MEYLSSLKQATTTESQERTKNLQSSETDYSRQRDLVLYWPTCDSVFILRPTKTPDDTCYLIYRLYKYLIMRKCVTSRYTNVELAQGTAYVRRTPPAPADKSSINGENVWVPAASSRHLTSSIMNIHNKSWAWDVRWPGMRTEPLWASPELSTDAVYKVYSFNSLTFLFPILVSPIVCVLHAKKSRIGLFYGKHEALVWILWL